MSNLLDRQVIENLSNELDDKELKIKELKSNLFNLFNELKWKLPEKYFEDLLIESFALRELYSIYGDPEKEELNFENNFLDYIKDSEGDDSNGDY